MVRPPRPPISPEKRRERYLEAVRAKMVKLYAYGEANPLTRTLEQLQFSQSLLAFSADGTCLSPV